MKHLVIDTDRCAGCSVCEAVCSLSHEGVVSPRFARLRIIDYYVEGHRIEGYVCKQCTGAECLRVCRPKALYVDKETGAKVIDPERCNGCKLCIIACPQHPNSPIYYDAATKKCLKCDLCGGDPLCVKFCPEAVLSLSKGGR
ncbi:MAG: 4Fe-4S dicluster domain-containing protein [Chloroflexi bacterium]|nr:4Fe-4S dicluster domain-containing protein [Chloroflexota bacterium]